MFEKHFQCNCEQFFKLLDEICDEIAVFHLSGKVLHQRQRLAICFRQCWAPHLEPFQRTKLLQLEAI